MLNSKKRFTFYKLTIELTNTFNREATAKSYAVGPIVDNNVFLSKSMIVVNKVLFRKTHTF